MFELKIKTKKYSSVIKDLVHYRDDCKEQDVVWSCSGEVWESFFNALFENDEFVFDYRFYLIQEISMIIIYDDEFLDLLVDKERELYLPDGVIKRLQHFNSEVRRIDVEAMAKLFNDRDNVFKFFALGDIAYYLLDVAQDNAKFEVKLDVK